AEAPCRRRHMISIHDVAAQPHIAEVKVKAAIPAINVRLRPKMSPRRPPVTRQTAYVSPYPAMTSSISLNEAPREVRMEGTPILAIKKSMTPRNGPTRMTARAIHLLAGSRWERA